MEELDAVELGKPLARVGGPSAQELAELDEPPLAEPGQVDHSSEGVQRLRGADVVGRLLAADVLLAGLEREHEPAPAVGVHRLARDPSRHPPKVLGRGAEEPERRAAEVEPSPERLALADRHVDPALARRAQDSERRRVDRCDGQRPGLLGGRGEQLEVLDSAEEARVLDHDGGRVGVERGPEIRGVGRPVVQAHLDDLGREPARIGSKRLAAVGVDAARDDETAAPGGSERQVGGRGDRRRPLVQRRVGDRQRAELGDRRLELEHHLEPALRDLGLVRRVGGQELRALGDRVDDRG